MEVLGDNRAAFEDYFYPINVEKDPENYQKVGSSVRLLNLIYQKEGQLSLDAKVILQFYAEFSSLSITINQFSISKNQLSIINTFAAIKKEGGNCFRLIIQRIYERQIQRFWWAEFAQDRKGSIGKLG